MFCPKLTVRRNSGSELKARLFRVLGVLLYVCDRASLKAEPPTLYLTQRRAFYSRLFRKILKAAATSALNFEPLSQRASIDATVIAFVVERSPQSIASGARTHNLRPEAEEFTMEK